MTNAITTYQGAPIEEAKPFDPNEFLKRYIEFVDGSQKTAETYMKAIRQLLTYFSLNGIKQPKREDIIAYREELKASGHKPTTVQSYITAVKLFFRWLAEEGLYTNIADHIKGAKLDREHKKDYLTSGQVKEVLDSIDTSTENGLRDYAMLFLMVTGGLRTIEVSRANVGDLRTRGDCVVLYVQGKGHDERNNYVKVSIAAEKAIRAYLKVRGNAGDDEPLFTSTSHNVAWSNNGSRMTTRAISGIVKSRLKSAGYDSTQKTAHSLRHSAVTLSIMAGMPVEEVQQFARHKNIATTMIYYHEASIEKNRCADAITQAITG